MISASTCALRAALTLKAAQAAESPEEALALVAVADSWTRLVATMAGHDVVLNGNNPDASDAEHLGPAVVPGRPSDHLGAFHAHSGWYFHRIEDGTVAIDVAESANAGAPRLVMAIFDADTWASIVAAVSAGGETGDRWRQACDFHTGSA